MTTQEFGKHYADQYDLLYSDKDYEKECDLVENIFQKYSKKSIKSILDLGCGTGNHAIPLAYRGYEVTGVDRSADMLANANHKAAGLPTEQKPSFHEGDVRTIDLHRKFDAAIMMFAVLGYQLTNEDVQNSLNVVRQHLNPGGIFVFDVWYGPAVLSTRPSDRVKVIPTDHGKTIRYASGSLDTRRHLSEVRYHLLQLAGDRVASETSETHHMRYFFPQELALFLQCANLKLVDIRSFDNINDAPDEKTWNVMVVGEAE